MKKMAISFDIDGTLGKQQSQINEKNQSNFIMEYAHTVKIEGDKFGDFVFFKGIMNLLSKVNELSQKYNFHIMLNTAGFCTPGCKSDRNSLIQNYINDCLSRQTNPIPLYDVRYQTFNRKDIVLAKQGKIQNSLWQDWFNGLFQVYSIFDLHVIDKDEDFKNYYYRDHQVILDKHRDIYKDLSLNNILHIDDSPASVYSFNKDKVNVIKVDRDHNNKITECDEIYSKIEKFILEKCLN